MSAERQEIARRNAVELVRRKLAPYVPADRLQEAAEALGAMWGEQCLMAGHAGRRAAAREICEALDALSRSPVAGSKAHMEGQSDAAEAFRAVIVRNYGLDVH